MKALLEYDGEFYGLEIAKDTAVAPNVVYASLSKLTDAGYLTSRVEDADERVGEQRPPRTYFKIANQTRAELLRGYLRLRGYDREVRL